MFRYITCPFIPSLTRTLGTFYAIGLGACGITNSGNDKIAAVSHLLFDVFPYVLFRLFSSYMLIMPLF